MTECRKGMFAISLAGHDKGSIYIVVACDEKFAYLSDGKIRRVDYPKKKRMKHLQLDSRTDELVERELLENGMLCNETIKKAIKNKKEKIGR